MKFFFYYSLNQALFVSDINIIYTLKCKSTFGLYNIDRLETL